MALPVERVMLDSYDVFTKRRTADQVEGGIVELYYPRNDIRNGNIEFMVEGNSDHCILPQKSFLRLTIELEGKQKKPDTDGTDKTISNGKAIAGPVNNILHSIFSSVDVYLSNQATTKTDHNYPYAAYLQTLCNYGEEPLNTSLAMGGCVKDRAGYMESIDGNNTGFEQRREMFQEASDRKIQLTGKLFSPIFQQVKILPSQVSMSVRLTKKADPHFYLMHEEGDFKINIVEAVLVIQKVLPTIMYKESYTKMLSDGTPIPYQLDIPSINFITIEPGSTQFVRENLFLGKTPKRIIFGLVETAAYQGSAKLNPFNFQHFNVSEIALYKDGVPYPRPVTKLDFENNRVVEAYQNFLLSLRADDCRFVPNVTLQDFRQGFTLYSYEMSPDQLGSINYSSMLNKQSNIRVEIKFARPTVTNITLLAYYENEHLLEIHEDRRVTVDF